MQHISRINITKGKILMKVKQKKSLRAYFKNFKS